MTENIYITPPQLREIRSLNDFDLTMFLSELCDHGWPMARKLLAIIMETKQKAGERRTEPLQ